MSEPTSDTVRSVDSPSAQDDALVARLLDGDEAAFLALVERHHASVLRLVGAFGHRGRSADDAARACWSAILDGLSSFRPTVPLKTWILAVAATALRRGVDDDRLDARRCEACSEPEAFDSTGRWVEPPVPWQEAVLATRRTAATIEVALMKLPWGERAVLVLRDVEGLTVEDASWALGVCAAEIASVLGRAREALRREIDACVRARTRRCTAAAA